MVQVTIAAMLSLLCLDSALAQENRCRITDPTGTPLNVRTAPYGTIIGQIPNGDLVSVFQHATDSHGKTWAYITNAEGPIGWVYREYISCF